MANAISQSATVDVPARFCVEVAADVLDELKAAAAGAGGLRLDLSAVTAVDTAGLQLLVVAVQGLSGQGGACELVDAPPALVEHARLLGVDGALQLG